jgi:hypothetical protein
MKNSLENVVSRKGFTVDNLIKDFGDVFGRSFIDQFQKLLNEWTEGQELVSYRINSKKGNLVVVTQCENQLSSSFSVHYDYSIFRFFCVACKVNVSVDLQEKSLSEMITKLMSSEYL